MSKYSVWEVAAAILYYEWKLDCKKPYLDCAIDIDTAAGEIISSGLSRLNANNAKNLSGMIKSRKDIFLTNDDYDPDDLFTLQDEFNIDKYPRIKSAYVDYCHYKEQSPKLKFNDQPVRITKITLENFKGIKDKVEIQLRPITMLFGGNSAGKSTIIHSLLYFRELLITHNCNPGKIMDGKVDFGDARNLVYGHEWNREISLRLDCNLDDDGLEPFFLDAQDGLWRPDLAPLVTKFWIEVRVAFELFSLKGYIKSFEVGLNEDSWAELSSKPTGEVFISKLNLEHEIITASNNNEIYNLFESKVFRLYHNEAGMSDEAIFFKMLDWSKIIKLNQEDSIPQAGQMLKFVDEGLYEEKNFENFSYLFSQSMVRPVEIILKHLNSMLYVGPLRELPDRQYYCPPTPDPARWATGLAAWDVFNREYQLKLQEVAQNWFNRLELGYDISSAEVRGLDLDNTLWQRLEALAGEGTISFDDVMCIHTEFEKILPERRIRIFDQKRKVEVQLQDIGIGISQSVPVVMGALHPGSIFAVEQPELHLHPAIQCRMGDLFIEQANSNGDKIFFLETHSEHLILRILRRIRETSANELPPGAKNYKFSPDKIVVLYFESTEDGTKVTELPVTPDGDFSQNWPNGFFVERAEELF